jgi:hypothetical protein
MTEHKAMKKLHAAIICAGKLLSSSVKGKQYIPMFSHSIRQITEEMDLKATLIILLFLHENYFFIYYSGVRKVHHKDM